MWTEMLDDLLEKLIAVGRLTVTGPGTRGARSFGPGQPKGGRNADGRPGLAPEVVLHIHHPDLPRRLLMAPETALGEGYMEGAFTIEGDDLHGLMEIVLRSRTAGPSHWAIRLNHRLARWARRIAQSNPMHRARANVAHHYDLSGDLYDLFLDSDRQYSCAYFRDPAMTLEEAQQAKKQHIAAKLLIEPGMRVLDIGCGWGGMALTLARDHGARVVGVTLSREQHATATRRAVEAGLADRVEFRLQDYRRVRESFDRIVSVGMFEHVGVPHYDEYFDTVARRLDPDGVALIHTIGRTPPPGFTSPWLTKYIFPGGYVPAMSEMMAAVEKTGLWSADMEVWRLHYARTLREWHDRFMANRDRAEALFDARFVRMWKYYLVACEQCFHFNGQVVFQLQLAHRPEVVPITRDYLYPAAETARMAAE